MRVVTLVVLSAFLVVSVFWSWVNFPQVRNKTLDFLRTNQYKTLEVRYSAESIMEAHKKELLKDSEHVFLAPSLKFHPYLLMEVKYSNSQDKTGEGMMLWSLVDGEMVINTNLWEKTHGFADCIAAGADREDYKLIAALATNHNNMDRENLIKELNIEEEKINNLIDTCKKKNLIVQSGTSYRLHFQNPKLQVIPETKIDQWLVTKKFKNQNRIPQKFRVGQIEYTAKAAFGSDFAIRKTAEIFLPVYSIVVQNPDGSQMTTYWNALNGKRLPQSFHIE